MSLNSAKLLIINKFSGDILLVRSKTHWSLPGGKIDNDETVLHCLARELMEEMKLDLNLIIQDIRLLKIYQKDGWNNALFSYMAGRYFINEFKVEESHEILEIKWWSIDEAIKACEYWADQFRYMKRNWEMYADLSFWESQLDLDDIDEDDEPYDDEHSLEYDGICPVCGYSNYYTKENKHWRDPDDLSKWSEREIDKMDEGWNPVQATEILVCNHCGHEEDGGYDVSW